MMTGAASIHTHSTPRSHSSIHASIHALIDRLILGVSSNVPPQLGVRVCVRVRGLVGGRDGEQHSFARVAVDKDPHIDDLFLLVSLSRVFVVHHCCLCQISGESGLGACLPPQIT